MVSDYKNADGDYRGVLERYLPTAYKTIGNGSDVHMGLLGALKQMLVTTEQDIIDGTQQMFLANANSWALDLYGDWVGESRKGELDDTYRARIIEKITLGRNTVGNIIVGIKREVNDPDLTVSVYEPWRNIFILNKSFLNGADRLIGKFYRYAVVQVTLNKYVNALELQMISDKYKSAGVSLVFVYREGIVAGDGALLALPLKLITENRNTVTRNRSQLRGTLLMNGLPTGTKATDLFTVNESDLNGDDVLASDPNSVYRGVYGTVPSKNIFGTTAPTAGMTSDPYDFIFQQSKVDLSTLGGRNLLLGTAKGVTGIGSNSTNGNFDAQGGKYYLAGGKKVSDLYNQYGSSGHLTISFDWVASGSTILGAFHPQWNNSPWGGLSGSDIKPSSTYSSGHHEWTISLGTDGYSTGIADAITFRQDNLQGNITISNVKLEAGNVVTAWTPAPEDTPNIYIHPYTGTDYTALNRLDGVTETVTASGLPTVAFNISEYVKGILEAKALNDSNRYGRNYILDTGNPKTQTSNGKDNQDLYDKAIFYKSLDQWAKTDTQYKISFDWNLKTVLTNDMVLTLVINRSPWQNLTVTIPANKLSGHVDISFTLWSSMISAKPTSLTFRIMSQMASGNTITYSNLFMKSGTIVTDWTPAPEDNPTAIDYTNFSTPVSSINVNLKGSPFGLAPTTITVLSQGATPLTGKWYKNGTLISPQTTQVSDATTPTGTWSFKLDTPTLVSSVTLTDNYPDSTGAYRVITMTTTDNRELVILNTTQQVTGTINTLRLQTQTPEIYRPYIKSAMIGDTTLSSPQVFDASTGNWVAITKSTNLVPYIAYGDVTNALYVALRNKTTQQNIDYLGLDITQVSVEGQ